MQDPHNLTKFTGNLREKEEGTFAEKVSCQGEQGPLLRTEHAIHPSNIPVTPFLRLKARKLLDVAGS